MKKIILMLLIALFLSSNSKAGCNLDTMFIYTFAPNSTVKTLIGRSIYKLDANGNTTEDFRQSWDATSAIWVNTVFYVYTFNTASLQTSYLYQNWVAGAWQAYLRGTNTYDVNNNLTKYIRERRNTTTGLWANESIEEYSYNSSGKEVESIYGSWNATTSLWDYTDDNLTTYTPTGQIAEIIVLSNNGTAWENGSRETYSYDAIDNLLSKTYQTWDIGTGAWVNSTQYNYSYNASNLLTQTIFKQWDIPSSSWKNKSRIDKVYLPNTSLSSETWYIWNTTGSVWDYSMRYLYTYTTAGYKDLETTQSYNLTSLTWVNIVLTDHNYDANNKEIETLESNWNTTTSTWQIITRKTYEYIGGNLVAEDNYSNWNTAMSYFNNHIRFEHHCRSTHVGIYDISGAEQFSLYPNPVSTQNLIINTLENTTFIISDIAGKTMQSGEVTIGENAIQLQDFSTGVYVVKVGNNTKRLIKN